MALRVGIVARHLSETLSGDAASYTAFGFSAVTGAVIYGILMRLFGISVITVGSLAAISLGCMLAAFVALFIFTFLARGGSPYYGGSRSQAACGISISGTVRSISGTADRR
jgi:tetrahydromethanopterin S-methyltransferase subunit E